MVVFGVDLHGLTFLVCLVELVLLCHQLLRCLCDCGQVRARCMVGLYLLLLCHNLSLGILQGGPKWLPEVGRQLLANGSAYAVAGFVPFYFYRAFGLSALRFHAYFGTSCFLLLPFALFHGLFYPLSGRLELATGYGMLVPMGYWLVVLWLLWTEVRRGKSRLLLVEVLALLPWLLLGMAVHLGAGQWLRVLLANGGFVAAGCWSVYVEVRWQRRRNKVRQLAQRNSGEVFSVACRSYGLTEREAEVALLLCGGMSYREVGARLFISERTVDSHAQRIFAKTGVNRKMGLRKLLGEAGLEGQVG